MRLIILLTKVVVILWYIPVLSVSAESSTTTAPVTIPPNWPHGDMVCDVPLDLCQLHAGTKTAAWLVACFIDTSKVPSRTGRCATVCLGKSEASQEKCTDFCLGYRQRCLQSTTQPDLVTVTKSPVPIGWPNTDDVICNVPLDICQQHSANRTSAWRVACFYDTSAVPPSTKTCSSVCLGKGEANQDRCTDYCSEYKKQCLQTTTPSTPTGWPYDDSVVCNISLDLCRQYSSSNSTAWHAFCYYDGSVLLSNVKLRPTICGSEESKEDHTAYCKAYNERCPVADPLTTGIPHPEPFALPIWAIILIVIALLAILSVIFLICCIRQRRTGRRRTYDFELGCGVNNGVSNNGQQQYGSNGCQNAAAPYINTTIV